MNSSDRVGAFCEKQHIQIKNRLSKTGAERMREFRVRKRGLKHATTLKTLLPTTRIPAIDNSQSTLEPSANKNSASTSAAVVERNSNDIRQLYTNFKNNSNAHEEFAKKFFDNPFGFVCDICDQLWFKNDLTNVSQTHQQLIHAEFPTANNINNFMACKSCIQSLNRYHVPILSKSNGFKYFDKPVHLPELDLISERLISPCLPFIKIKILENQHNGHQCGILGEAINDIPVNVMNTLVRQLPRNIHADPCINNIKPTNIRESNKDNLVNLINKQNIRVWLEYLCDSPLYKLYNITINHSFFDDTQFNKIIETEMCEDIIIDEDEDSFAVQHPLLWNNNEKSSHQIAPDEINLSHSLLFDENIEELLFPSIYLGRARASREVDLHLKPLVVVMSVLRRADRRGVTPYHLIYLTMKIMRLRVYDYLKFIMKNSKKNFNITREQIKSKKYIDKYIETNLAFLRCIPNSNWYWNEIKRDLFATIRQLGKPTLLLTFSANEIAWIPLLKILYKLQNNGNDILDEMADKLIDIQKNKLINNDAITCAIYFNKLINVLMNLLQSKKNNPFGEYRVIHYFKEIEFQHQSCSPNAHIFLWLENAPVDPLGTNRNDAITLIDKLFSVSIKESSEQIKYQIHKHTFACYGKVVDNKPQKCRFEAPFMPCKNTTILTPMNKTNPNFVKYAKHFARITVNHNYPDMNTFYEDNGITSDEHYIDILRSGITQPRVFLKRHPTEKWHNAFNPFILNVLQTNIDMHFILDEYSCANHITKFINKADRNKNDLQHQIIKIMDENPEFDIIEITKKITSDLLNNFKITSQEAAWYLLREPLAKSSSAVVYIPTVWPSVRQKFYKTRHEKMTKMKLYDDSTEIWKENWFDKYQTRPRNLENLTLARFVANYISLTDKCIQRNDPYIIWFENYDMTTNINEYKREMVTLHLPFRNEETEFLADMKFIDIYDKNEKLILLRRKEFESDFDIKKMIEICRQLCQEEVEDMDVDSSLRNLDSRQAEVDSLQPQSNDSNSKINSKSKLVILNQSLLIEKNHEDSALNEQKFHDQMNVTNKKQKNILKTNINDDLLENCLPFKIFFTGSAACKETFVIRLLMIIYNHYKNTDGSCDVYIKQALTSEDASIIDGTITYTALKISLSNILELSLDVLRQYRVFFKNVQILIIDEVNIIEPDLLFRIDDKLKQIIGKFDINFGGLDIILTGVLKQLAISKTVSVYKQTTQQTSSQSLWHGFKYFELDKVMQQSNRTFSDILTKIKNNLQLEKDELQLLESRFFTKAEVDRLCPGATRLFWSNTSVDQYNQSVLNSAKDKFISKAKDVITGCYNTEEEKIARQKLREMSIVNTGGLPHEIQFVVNKSYMLTVDVDALDGLVTGVIGKLVHTEFNEAGQMTHAWLQFTTKSSKIGERISACAQPTNISRMAIPIAQKTSTIYLDNNKIVTIKRNHFPLIPACAITIYKSQGKIFNEIVYEYAKTHSQQLLYVALSRVTNIYGLYIVTSNDELMFHHGRKTLTSMGNTLVKLHKLALNKLSAINKHIINFMTDRKGLSVFSLNYQGLNTNRPDSIDEMVQQSTFVFLSETGIQNEGPIEIPNFDCIVKFKQPEVNSGVAIYHNSNEKATAVTDHMEIILVQVSSLTLKTTEVGEICAARCTVESGQTILIVAIYVSPNKKISDIINFIHEVLISYTFKGASLLKKNYDEIPIMMRGDFNINFTKPEAKPLIDFLDKKYKLKMNRLKNSSTVNSETTIDVVFCRYLGKLSLRAYISYFSYHKSVPSSESIEDTDP